MTTKYYQILYVMMSLVIAWFPLSLGAQTQEGVDSCYKDLMSEADSVFNLQDWQVAIDLYNLARACPDINYDQDQTARVMRDSAIQKQLDLLERRRATADSQYQQLKRQEEMLKIEEAKLKQTIDQLESGKQLLQLSTTKANRLAIESEANRLANVSSGEVVKRNFEDAMLYANLATWTYDSLFSSRNSEDKTLRKTFSQAVFYNCRSFIGPFNDDIVKVDFLGGSDKLLARLKKGGLVWLSVSYNPSINKYEIVEEKTRNRGSTISDLAYIPQSGSMVFAQHDGSIMFKQEAVDSTLLLNDAALLYKHHDTEPKVKSSDNGEGLVSWSRGGEVQFYKMQDGKPVALKKNVNASANNAPVTGVEFSADGKYVLTASPNKKLLLWNLEGAVIDSFIASAYIGSFGFVENRDHFFVCEATGLVSVIDQGEVKRANTYHNKDVVLSRIVQQDNGPKLITASTDGTVLFTDLNKMQVSDRVRRDSILSAAISEDDKTLLLVTNDSVIFYNIDQDSLIHQGQGKLRYRARFVNSSLSSDGRYALILDESSRLTIWYMDGTQLDQLPVDYQTIYEMGFTPDNKGIWCYGRENGWLFPLPHLLHLKRKSAIGQVSPEKMASLGILDLYLDIIKGQN